jgi:serine protease Do
MTLRSKVWMIPIVAAIAVAAARAQEPAPRPRVATTHVAVQRGSYLGIGVADIDTERAKALNLKEERGAEVTSVDPEGPAGKAGLKEGDVVLEYNGQRVEGTEQFVRMVRETPPGRQARLTVWRSGSTQSLTAVVGTRRGGWRDDNAWVSAMPPMPPMPPMPQINIPPMPDLSRNLMTWRSGVLGIEGESVNSQLAEYFGVKEGVLVRSVVKGSAAEKAGLKAGDVIIKVDGSTVTSPREISSILRSIRSKKTFPVVLVRNQKQMTVTLTQEDNQVYHGSWPTGRTARFC